MDRMLYIGMTAAVDNMYALRSVSNNLANATTTGFREDLEQFRSMPVFGPGHPTRAYAMVERPGLKFTPGPLQSTGRSLDVAIKGQGWLAIQAPDGKEALTRAGNLSITPNGQLVDGTGNPVLGQSGPIAIPPAQKIEIANDGTISIEPAGDTATGMVTVDRIKMVNPPLKDLVKGKDGLIRDPKAQPLPADASVHLVSGMLEGSNVNTVKSMVQMINLQRNYEMQIKAMSAANQVAQQASSVIRING